MIYIGFNTTILWTEKSLTHSLKKPHQDNKELLLPSQCMVSMFQIVDTNQLCFTTNHKIPTKM